MRRCLLTSICLLAAASTAASDHLPGPYPAEVLGIVDGDTLKVRVMIWLGQTVETDVRLAGLDTPELRGKCADERGRAQAARQALGDLVAAGPVHLADIRSDKYGGRVIARVLAADGRDLAGLLIAHGLGRPYDGSARTGWCG